MTATGKYLRIAFAIVVIAALIIVPMNFNRYGLYILKYTGPHADEVAAIKFLEGNSNLGDAVRLAS